MGEANTDHSVTQSKVRCHYALWEQVMAGGGGRPGAVGLPRCRGSFWGSNDPSEAWMWMRVPGKGPGRIKGSGASGALRKMTDSHVREGHASGEMRPRGSPDVQAS